MNFGLIFLIILSTLASISCQIHKTHKKRDFDAKPKCQDPDIQILQNQLAEFETLFRLYKENLYLSNTFENGKSLILRSMGELIENSECKIAKRNVSNPGAKSQCPWRRKIEYREDKFPHYVHLAVCTCKSCHQINEDPGPSSVGCLPIMTVSPVLVKDEKVCDKDGFYVWKATIEELSSGCTCSFKEKLVPY